MLVLFVSVMILFHVCRPWPISFAGQFRFTPLFPIGYLIVPTKVRKVGGIQKSLEIRVARFSFAASPLSLCVAVLVTPNTIIPKANVQLVSIMKFSSLNLISNGKSFR